MDGLKRVVSKGKVYTYPRKRYTEVKPRHQRNLADFVSRYLYPAARGRAAAAGLEFSLTSDDLLGMLDNQGYRCALSGIDFEFGSGDRAHLRTEPWRPSVDRRDAAKGYTPDNCRIVCWAVNVALGEWGEDAVFRIADGIIKNGKLPRRKRKTVS